MVKLATDPAVRAQLGAAALKDIDDKLAVVHRALEYGGYGNAQAAGEVIGSVAVTVIGAVDVAYGAAKAAETTLAARKAAAAAKAAEIAAAADRRLALATDRLKFDPARGVADIGEGRAGAALEEYLGIRLVRPSGNAAPDFVVDSPGKGLPVGTTIDVKFAIRGAANPELAQAGVAKSIRTGSVTRNLVEGLAKHDRLAVDFRDLTQANAEGIQAAINKLPSSLRKRIITIDNGSRPVK